MSLLAICVSSWEKCPFWSIVTFHWALCVPAVELVELLMHSGQSVLQVSVLCCAEAFDEILLVSFCFCSLRLGVTAIRLCSFWVIMNSAAGGVQVFVRACFHFS
jgi:hypothetical protein